MQWDDLRIFLAVARTGTLSPAAKRLGVDATTVSRRLTRLETSIGRSLFDIGPAGHTLTAQGQQLRNHVEAMESAAIAGTENSKNAHLTATIRVSVSEGFGTWIIAPYLHEFASQHPDLAVELVASTGFLNPSKREADIAIMLARPKRGPLVVRKLTDYELGLYSRLDSMEITDPVDLLTQRLVGYVPDLLYAPELNYLDEVAEGLEAALSSTSVNAQAALIRSGAGCGILPCFIGEQDPDLSRSLPAKIAIRRSFWLVVHRDLRRAHRVQRFMEWLDQLIGRMQPVLLGGPLS